MKSLVLVAATALLGACASAPTSADRAVASSADTNAYGRDVDGRQINAINNVARTNGVDVHGINYPEAKPTARTAEPAPAATGT